MTLTVGNKLEVLREDVAEKANLPEHALPQDRVVAVKPLPEQRLHFPVSSASRYGHVTTGDHW